MISLGYSKDNPSNATVLTTWPDMGIGQKAITKKGKDKKSSEFAESTGKTIIVFLPAWQLVEEMAAITIGA